MEESRCQRCGHREAAHLESGPEGNPWCRLCYGHQQLHRARNHAFEA
ncbi:MAG: hypothetical protein K1X87_02670 [Dehalococcoidia bacterium]|nr:hypothetical protein [Dehalococcoidia bacterium]